jgi:hypothetical protein
VLFSGRAVVKRLGIEGKMQTRISERPMPTQKKPKRTERLQFFVSTDELSAIDEFRFENRMPSRAAAVREIFRRALSAAEKEERSRRH